MAESPVQKKSFFGWSPVVKDMWYSIKRFPDDEPLKEELVIFEPGERIGGIIPGDTLYTARRNLSDDGTAVEGSPTSVYAKQERDYNTALKLAFDGNPPCDAKFYTQDLCRDIDNDAEFEKKQSCFPGQHDIPCGVWDLYTGADGNHITRDFQMAGLTAAKYYTDRFNFQVGRGDVTGTKIYDIDEKTGEIKQTRLAKYDAGLREQYDKWDLWRKAQRCDGVVKSGTAFVALSGCAPFIWNTADMRSLVGKPEPPFPAAVEGIDITDVGADGKTDSVYASWLRAPGNFKVEKRSTYTQGMLTYFDGFWQKVKNTKFEYFTPAAPVELNIKEGDLVSKGTTLFTYQTNQGLKTFRAEVDGKVSKLTTNGEGGVYLTVEAVEKGQKNPGFLRKAWRYFFG